MSRRLHTYIEARERPWNIGRTAYHINADHLNQAGIDATCIALQNELDPDTYQICVVKSNTELDVIP